MSGLHRHTCARQPAPFAFCESRKGGVEAAGATTGVGRGHRDFWEIKIRLIYMVGCLGISLQMGVYLQLGIL